LRYNLAAVFFKRLFERGIKVKEQLVSLLVSKVGLDQEKAEKSVDTVLDFFKNNPEKASELLGKLPGGLGDKIGGMFG
jgi:DNA polymerase III delta subunit